MIRFTFHDYFRIHMGVRLNFEAISYWHDLGLDGAKSTHFNILDTSPWLGATR